MLVHHFNIRIMDPMMFPKNNKVLFLAQMDAMMFSKTDKVVTLAQITLNLSFLKVI